MKIIHEVEEEEVNALTGEKEKVIKKVKEVKDKPEAIKDKTLDKKNYVHYCYHDEERFLPCRREEI